MKTFDIIKPIRGSHKHLARALALGSWLAAGTALAAPANDDFVNAIILPGDSGTQTGTDTIGATIQASEPLPGATEVNTVWFKWACTADGAFTVDTVGSTDPVPAPWDAILGVYSGAVVNALTPLGATPKDTGAAETMTIPVTAGNTYYIQLAGWNNTVAANIQVNWNFVATVYEANILTFGPGAVVDEIIGDTAPIAWTVPYGTNLATLAPTFTLSPGATCNRTSGVIPSPNLGAGSVVYTVTAQDSSVINNYTVTATASASVLWNVAGGGDWDFSTSSWLAQPSNAVSLFADSDDATFNNATGGTINIPSTVSPGTTTIGAASGDYTFSGAQLGGTGSLTKNGTSTLTLASTNSYSGATVVNGGTLVANGNGSLGSSASFSVATGSILQLNGTNAAAYKWPAVSATLTGGGTVNIPLGSNNDNVGLNFNMSAFNGTLNLTSSLPGGGMVATNPNYSSGFIAPLNGTINVGDNTTLYLGWEATAYTTTVRLSSATDNGEGLGVLRGDNATLNGAVILAANSTIGTAGGSLTINSVISDGGSGFGFTQVGSGTVTLTAVTNTYTGPTTVNGGATLKCDTPGSLGGGALSINGKVNLNHAGNRDVASLKLSGVSKAPGVYGSSASGAPPANQDNARFAGTGTVTVLPPVVVVGKTVLWNVAGGGNWDLSTSNWLTQPSNAVSTFVNNDVAIFNNPAGGTINIPSTVSPFSTTVNAASGDYIFSGAALGGTGSLTMNGLGSLTLNSPNTYSGNTVINNGTLVVNGTSAVAGSTSFSVAAGAILQLNGTTNSKKLWPEASGSLTGAGTVNLPLNGQAGVGTTFDMSTFTGNLNISGGLMGVNTVHSPGFVSPVNGTINVGNATTLYLGWTGFVLNTTVVLNSSTDNGEARGVLRGDNATLNGAVILNTNSTIGSSGLTSIFTINAVISGGSGFGFTNVRDGTVILTAANTYTGPTTVNSPGTLQCNTPGSLGGGALSINGKLNLNYVGTKTVASLTLGGVAKTVAGTYGSVASGATFQDDTYFTPGSTGTVTVVATNSFSSWASINAPGQTPSQDYDNDGVQNGMEYFMGQMGSSFTAMPGLDGTNKVTWTKDPTYQGTWQVQTSPDLSTWTNVAGTDIGTSVSYTVPPGMGKQFVRMVVTPAP